MGLEKYSDDELMQIAGIAGVDSNSKLSDYSDEELMEIAGVSPSPAPNVPVQLKGSSEGQPGARDLGIWQDFIKPTLKAIPRVAGATVGSLAALPIAGIAGLSELAASRNLGKAERTLRAVAGYPAKLLLTTPEEEKGAENIGLAMKPFEMAGSGWRGLAELATTGDIHKAADVVEGRSPGSNIAVPIAGTIGEASAMFALPKLPKAIKDSNFYRGLTIKERGLALQSLADTMKANPEMSEGQILRTWNNPTWQAEALGERTAGEIFKDEGVPQRLLPEPVDQFRTRGPNVATIAGETQPFNPEIAERLQPGPLALPPGQGFEVVGDKPRGFELAPSTAIQMPEGPIPPGPPPPGLVDRGKAVFPSPEDFPQTRGARPLGLEQFSDDELMRIAGITENPPTDISQLEKPSVELKEKPAPKNQTFLGWIKDRGGLWDESLKGEIRELGTKEEGVIGLTNKKTGQAIDELTTSAIIDGWLPEGSTSTDFLGLLNKDLKVLKEGRSDLRARPYTSNEFDRFGKKVMKAGDKAVADEVRAMEKQGFMPVKEKMPIGDLEQGDKILMQGEEFTHTGFDKDGNAIIKDGETFRLDPFDQLPVDGIKKVTPIEKKIISESKSSPFDKLREQRGSFSRESLKEKVENLTDSPRAGRNEKGVLRRTVQGFSEELQSPEKVLGRDPAGKQSYENLDRADQQKNAFLIQEGKKFQEAAGKIKADSGESGRVGQALDGKLDPKELNREERPLYDFLKKEYDYLINRYARQQAGSDEAYKKILDLANQKDRPKMAVEQLDEAASKKYTSLRNQAAKIRGDKKLSGLNPEQADQYWKLRDQALDLRHQEWLKTLSEGEREAYLTLSRKIKDYLPHIFDKDVLLDNFKTEISGIQNKLRTATNKTAVTSLKNRLKEVEEAVVKLESGELVTYESLPRNVRFRFFETRKGKEGYSFDALKSFQAYISGIARKMYDEPAIRKAAELHKDMAPDLKDYHKWYIRHYMGWDRSKLDPLANTIASFEWMRTLGFNPRSAIVNMTQRLNTIAEVGEKASLAGEKLGFTEKGKALFDSTGIAKEIPGVLMEGAGPASMEKARAIAGFMFNKAELANRKHAFLSGYSKAKSLGKSEAEAIRYGIDTVHKTQFRYGRVGMPKALTRPGGRILGQFSSYSIKQLELMADWAKNDPLKLVKYLGYATGTTLGAQQFLNIDLSNALGFVSNYGELIDALAHIPEGDWRGVLRHTRVAFSGGAGVLPSGPGPAVSGAYKIYEGMKEGRGIEALKKELTPIVYDRIKQAVKAVKSKQGDMYPIKNKDGHIMYFLTAPELVTRTIGPKTYRESMQYAKKQGAILLEEERKSVLREITRALLDNDTATVNKLTKQYQVFPSEGMIYNEALKRQVAPEMMPKAVGLREAYQLQREGKLYR